MTLRRIKKKLNGLSTWEEIIYKSKMKQPSEMKAERR